MQADEAKLSQHESVSLLQIVQNSVMEKNLFSRRSDPCSVGAEFRISDVRCTSLFNRPSPGHE